ncbi:8561_t:CDS:2 [Cetraspora pellucida]|uniref:8561_t:CDS:1 n=1 Tax=Cetraspora pellucida TaxID=1433469 RepID=A0A9N8W3Q6_9GLOM|nr:8561_t:CDS:2 [Cetraspora pellucida]
MTQSSKFLILVLYEILITLTPTLADMSSDIINNDTNDTKSTYITSNSGDIATSVRLDSPENINDFKLFYADENNLDANEVRIRNNNNTGSEMARKRSNLEKRVSNKIISYVLVFILQWTPVQIFCAAKFFQIDSAWIYVVCVIGVHFGGLGNAIQYIVNEGWHPRNIDSNVSWSFAESPSHFLKRFYPNSRNMHTFDKYGTTNSIGSDFLNNANSSNNSVKELNCNPYNIEINIDTDNFVAESEIALSKHMQHLAI